jgi:hypothetical protein
MQSVQLIRKLLPYTSVAVVLVMIYVGWTFFSRWRYNHAGAQAAEAEQAKANAKIVEMYGSGDLKILNFYAEAKTLRPGEKTLLCYGVANAVSVRIEPGIEPVKTSLSRCVEVAPSARTEYTLTAEDGAGHRATQSLVINVK